MKMMLMMVRAWKKSSPGALMMLAVNALVAWICTIENNVKMIIDTIQYTVSYSDISIITGRVVTA